MGGGLESCCVGCVYGADGAVRLHGTIRTNRKSTSNAPDDGRIYPKHVELRIHR